MTLIKKIDEWLAQFEKILVALLLFIMTAVIFWGVVERFILKLGQTWIEEFARYVSVWAALVGAGLGVKMGAHIGVEAFVLALPRKTRARILTLVSAIGFAFCTIVAVVGFQFLPKLLASNQMSPALRIPVAWAYAAIPFGCTLMAIHYSVQVLLSLFGREDICEKEGLPS